MSRILIPHKTEEGLVYLSDETGFIELRKNWEDLRSRVDQFFCHVTDEEIERYNTDLHKQYFGCEPQNFERKHPEPVFSIPAHLTQLPRFSRTKGWLYWLAAEGKEGTKIGETSKNLRQRTKGNARDLQLPVTIIDAFQTKNHRRLEKQLHEHFKAKRIRGDWFNLTAEEIKDIPILAYHFNSAMEVAI